MSSSDGFFDELDHLRAGEQRAHGGQVVRAAPAPLEGRLVVVDLHAVELDRAHQRRAAQRHAALLPRVAEHQRVGVDRVAEQLRRHLLGVERAELSRRRRGADRRLAVAAGELPVGVARRRPAVGAPCVFSAT